MYLAANKTKNNLSNCKLSTHVSVYYCSCVARLNGALCYLNTSITYMLVDSLAAMSTVIHFHL